MDVKIKVVKKNGICYSNGADCVIDIPDDMLLKLGKKYFELAAKDEKRDTIDDNSELMDIAQKLRRFCLGKMRCEICQFCLNPKLSDGGGTYKCKIGCPSNWEV